MQTTLHVMRSTQVHVDVYIWSCLTAGYPPMVWSNEARPSTLYDIFCPIIRVLAFHVCLYSCTYSNPLQIP